MGRLTTHVLDTALGRPAAGISLALFKLVDSQRHLITRAITNHDGRCTAPLLEGSDFFPGTYELEFDAGAYFTTAGVSQPAGIFLEHVVLRFVIDNATQHYHVPLLLSPYGYSTYRGS
jgi:5-hydroxyisourate hydrolase